MRCFARFALAHACHLNLLEAAHDILSKAVACVLRGVRDGGWQACSVERLKSGNLDFHFRDRKLKNVELECCAEPPPGQMR